MNFGLFEKVREVTLILTLSNLLRMVWLQPPFCGCSRDEVTDALESLIHDTVLGGRGVKLSIVNDIVDGPARRWAWPFRRAATIVLIEPGLLIKRRRGTLACRILRATSGELARTLLDRYRQDLSDDALRLPRTGPGGGGRTPQGIPDRYRPAAPRPPFTELTPNDPSPRRRLIALSIGQSANPFGARA